jgi:hypothetical protein
VTAPLSVPRLPNRLVLNHHQVELSCYNSKINSRLPLIRGRSLDESVEFKLAGPNCKTVNRTETGPEELFSLVYSLPIFLRILYIGRTLFFYINETSYKETVTRFRKL